MIYMHGLVSIVLIVAYLKVPYQSQDKCPDGELGIPHFDGNNSEYEHSHYRPSGGQHTTSLIQ